MYFKIFIDVKKKENIYYSELIFYFCFYKNFTRIITKRILLGSINLKKYSKHETRITQKFIF